MHIPVLQKEVLECLDPKPDENFIDCTIGDGGHALAILEKTAPRGKLLGMDLDEEQIKNLRQKTKNFSKRLVLVNGNYANLESAAREFNFKNVSGILLDIGFSSWHIDESKRGFTFSKNEPLDMRYDVKIPQNAEKILNYWSEREIEKILSEYGQERFARQIASGIIAARKIVTIKSTFQLVEIIKRAVPAGYRSGKINCATKTFQALRIAVNGELDNLEKVLPQAENVLKKHGRLAVISFHSLEDRIVKDFFKKEVSKEIFLNITKKPVSPSGKEIAANPRARSAKLRVAEKIV